MVTAVHLSCHYYRVRVHPGPDHSAISSTGVHCPGLCDRGWRVARQRWRF